MKVTPAAAQFELIGLKARVVKSKQPSYKGIRGIIVDENRNTLVIRHKNRDKVVAKNISVFHFTLPDGTILEIDGSAILGRPEDRVKKHFRRRW